MRNKTNISFLRVFLLIGIILSADITYVEAQGAGAGFGRARSMLMRVRRVLRKIAKENVETKDLVVRKDVTILVTEPSWMLPENRWKDQMFNLTTDLVFAEYDINPTSGKPSYYPSLVAFKGSLADDKEIGGEVNIIQKSNHINEFINYLIAVSAYGGNGIDDDRDVLMTDFFESATKKRIFLDSLTSITNYIQSNYDIRSNQTGIVLDLKGLPNDEDLKNRIITFIQRMRDDDYLPYSAGHKIYLKMDINSDQNEFYDEEFISSIDPFIDLYVVSGNGLNFNNAGSELQSPSPQNNRFGSNYIGDYDDKLVRNRYSCK